MSLPEYLYYLGYSFKKRRTLRNQKRLPCPVISIGNLTVGGAGKTPASIAVAGEAERRGYCPVILTRGYRGQAKGPCFVSKGNGRLLSVTDSGDEPALMAERLPGAMIVKSADRYEGGLLVMNEPGRDNESTLFILDDGFQHWGLARDVDIVLVDGIRAFGNRRLIPLGGLRGPLEELKKADILVITKTRNDALASELKKINPGAPLHFSEYRAVALRGPDGSCRDLNYLRGKKVFAFCGLASPASFRRTLENTGCVLTDQMSYRDHYSYTRLDIGDLAKIAKRFSADFILTTEKDLVKIKEFQSLPENLYALQVDFSVGSSFFDDVFSRINKKCACP